MAQHRNRVFYLVDFVRGTFHLVPRQAGYHADVVRRGPGVRRYVKVPERLVRDRILQYFDVHQQERVQLAKVRDRERGEHRRGQYRRQNDVADFRPVVQQADDYRSGQEQVSVASDVPRLYHALHEVEETFFYHYCYERVRLWPLQGLGSVPGHRRRTVCSVKICLGFLFNSKHVISILYSVALIHEIL